MAEIASIELNQETFAVGERMVMKVTLSPLDTMVSSLRVEDRLTIEPRFPAFRIVVDDDTHAWEYVTWEESGAFVFEADFIEGGTVYVELLTLGTTEMKWKDLEETPRPTMLVGMTSGPGAPHNAMMAAFPGIAYTADFGSDSGDSDSLTELPAWGSGKQTNAEGVTFHFSWKDDVEQLVSWLNMAPADTKPFFLSWWHEPHGDVAPATYRATGSRLAEILEFHPRKNLVLGHGPVVTRWWATQPGNSLEDWWYPEATMIVGDVYNDAMDRYRPVSEMFQPFRDFARSKGVKWGIREWGLKRINGDTSGQGRIAAMRDQFEYAMDSGDCLFLGWWNFGDTPPSSKIIGIEPEQTAFREIMTDAGQ